MISEKPRASVWVVHIKTKLSVIVSNIQVKTSKVKAEYPMWIVVNYALCGFNCFGNRDINEASDYELLYGNCM